MYIYTLMPLSLSFCDSLGDTVSFSHVDLPKGTFVRLQPISSSWLVRTDICTCSNSILLFIAVCLEHILTLCSVNVAYISV